MSKNKRINPRRVPLPNDKTIKAQILDQSCQDNSIYAWILVLHSMLFHAAHTEEERAVAWNIADAVKLHEKLGTVEIRLAEDVMGLRFPYPKLSMQKITSLGDALSFERKAKANALFFGLCSIALGLKELGSYDPNMLHRIFSNVDLTLAEIEHGSNSYESVAREIEECGRAVGRKTLIELPG